MINNDDLIKKVLTNPKAIRAALDKFESEQSLINFMKLGWSILEPGRDMVTGWVMEAICDHLEAVSRGELTRLLITVPPGTSKSLLSNVFFPAWEWGPKNMAHLRYLNFSHEAKLSMRDNKRCRTLIMSDWYQELWGDRVKLTRDQNEKVNYENTMRGFRQTGSVSAGQTGKRGDRLILDDLHSVRKAESDTIREEVLMWLTEEISSRLNDLDLSAIIMIMQRVHSRDAAGLVLEKDFGYEHLMVPMRFESDRRCYSTIKPSYMDSKLEKVHYHTANHTWQKYEPDPIKQSEWKTQERYNVDPRVDDGQLMWPERFTETGVSRLEKEVSAIGGNYAIAGQLQQRPSPREGGMFKMQHFQYVDSANEFKFRKIVRGWDLAASDKRESPYTVGCKMGITADDIIVILDIYRVKHTPGRLEQGILNVAKADGINIEQDFPQDPGSAGKVQRFSLAKLLHGFKFRAGVESGSKETRAEAMASQFASGTVFLLRAPWNDQFVTELCGFPTAEFKDQVDAMSRAYANLLKTRLLPLPGTPRTN